MSSGIAMDLLTTAFDPATFRSQGHLLIDALADRLAASLSGESAVCSTVIPLDELAHWESRLTEPPETVAAFLEEVAERSIQLHHPHYVGHQVCAPAPAAALAGLASEFLNNGMAIYEMGPSATALERLIIRRTATLMGLPEGDGFLTSGGTLANLTALLGARARMLGDSILSEGTPPNWSVMTSEESHYCITRAVQVMGGGRDGVVTVPTDAVFKMRVELLDELYEAAVACGRPPIAVVGSACTTSTGSYDDLVAISEFCRRRKLWFHVDGAHGAAVAFCPELAQRLRGLEMADSVILDFHKLLLTPALATAVIFREPKASWAAFHARAQYLWDDAADEEWHNIGRRSFECTKLSMSVKIAAILRTGGEPLLAEHLRTVHRLAQDFTELLRNRPNFEVALTPESNIVCFRHHEPGMQEDALDQHNARLRRDIIATGRFYLVQTVLRGRTWLRCALMNPFTQVSHLRELLNELERLAK